MERACREPAADTFVYSGLLCRSEPSSFVVLLFELVAAAGSRALEYQEVGENCFLVNC